MRTRLARGTIFGGYILFWLQDEVGEAIIDKMSVGSDIHAGMDLWMNTVRAIRLVEAAGYSHLGVYEGRRNRRGDITECGGR